MKIRTTRSKTKRSPKKTTKQEKPMNAQATETESPEALSPIKKILEMVRTGALTDEQAATLIRELNAKEEPASSSARGQAAQGPAGFNIKNFFSNSMDRLFASDALHNNLRASHLESPEGTDFVFKDNEITMSNLREFILNRASFERNKVSGSNLKELRVEDSHLTDSSFKMSNLRDTRVSGSDLSRWSVTASNLRDLTIDQSSQIDEFEMRASSMKDMLIRKSVLTRFGVKESSVKDIAIRDSKWIQSLVQWSSLSDLSFDTAAMTGVQFLACHLSDFQIHRSELEDFLINAVQVKDTLIRDCHFRDVLFANNGGWRRHKYDATTFEKCQFKRILFSNCRFEKVTFRNITAENVQLSGVFLKNEVVDGNEAFLRLASARPAAEATQNSDPKDAESK